MTTLYSWIHLSDIHAGHGSRAHRDNQARILEQLVLDISSLRQEGYVEHDVEALFVTGDIAFSGGKQDPREYETADQFIKNVAHAAGFAERGGIARERIFLIPGNHDVARGEADFNNWFNSDRRDPEGVAQFETDRAKAEKIENRFAAYKSFAGNYNRLFEGLDWITSHTSRNGLKIHVHGWNTAWLSNDNEDQGLLRIRSRARQELQRKRVKNEVVFLLSHHPLTERWLNDENDLANGIRNYVDIHLSGHVHVAATRQLQAGTRDSLIQIHAGAVHLEEIKNTRGVPVPSETPPLEHCYNFGRIVQVEEDKLEVIIQPRRWHARANQFRWDVQGLPDHTFKTSHPLSVRSATRKRPEIELGVRPLEQIPYPELFDHVTSLEASWRRIRVLSLTGFSLCDDNRTGPLRRFFRAGGHLTLATLDPSGKNFYAGYDLTPESRREKIERIQREVTSFASNTSGNVEFLYLDEHLTYSSVLFGDIGVFLPHPTDQNENHSDWMRAIIYKDDSSDPLASFLRHDWEALKTRNAFRTAPPR